MAKAPAPFWLDGGYDRDTVEGCAYHPLHRWWTFWLSDVLLPGAYGVDQQMVICRACYVPRCGHAEDDDPCMLARHHLEDHSTRRGAHEPVGG